MLVSKIKQVSQSDQTSPMQITQFHNTITKRMLIKSNKINSPIPSHRVYLFVCLEQYFYVLQYIALPFPFPAAFVRLFYFSNVFHGIVFSSSFYFIFHPFHSFLWFFLSFYFLIEKRFENEQIFRALPLLIHWHCY